MEKISLEQLEEMQKDLFKKQCDLDLQKAFVKHFIEKKQRELLINFMEWFNNNINSDGILENEIDLFLKENEN